MIYAARLETTNDQCNMTTHTANGNNRKLRVSQKNHHKNPDDRKRGGSFGTETLEWRSNKGFGEVANSRPCTCTHVVKNRTYILVRASVVSIDFESKLFFRFGLCEFNY